MNYVLKIMCNKYVDYCIFGDANNKKSYIAIYFYHKNYENIKDFYFFIMKKEKHSKILRIEKPFDVISLKDIKESDVWHSFNEDELDDLKILMKNFYKLTKFDIRYGL